MVGQTGEDRFLVGTRENAFTKIRTAYWSCQRQRPRYDDARRRPDASLRTEGEDVTWLRTIDDALDVILDDIEKRTADTPRPGRFVQVLLNDSFTEATRKGC